MDTQLHNAIIAMKQASSALEKNSVFDSPETLYFLHSTIDKQPSSNTYNIITCIPLYNT